MKQLFNRLKGCRGETLVESLAAILIFTFGSIIMLSMITSAATINNAVKEADQNYFKDLQVVEKADPSKSTTSSIKFSIHERSETISVDVYRRESNSLYAYYRHHDAS